MLGECFDPTGEMLNSGHCRPHWSQAGAVVFITFRTHDSLPHEVLHRWDQEKLESLGQRGYQPGPHWSDIVPTPCRKRPGRVPEDVQSPP